MRKVFLFLVMICLVDMVIGEEFLFRAIKDTTYTTFGEQFVRKGVIRKNGTLRTTNNLAWWQTNDGDDFKSIIYYQQDNKLFGVETQDFIPLNTQDLFSDDITVNHDRINSVLWIPDYYIDVLKSKDRNTLLDIETEWLSQMLDDMPEIGFIIWYDAYEIDWSEILFYNSGIHVGAGNALIVKNIQKTEYGYRVTCMESMRNNNRSGVAVDWSFSDETTMIELLMYLDGDYIDLYINNTAQKFGTIVRVQKEFTTQLNRLIKTNKCDLAKVQWPQRAAKNIETGKTYTTVENMRLRTTESRESEVIATLPTATAVQVLEKGAEDTIDSIKANWVKVRLGDGAEGWCFGGYLMPIVVSPVVVQETAVIGEAAEPKSGAGISAPAAPQKAPLPWFVIGGGVLVPVGCVALFLARRRKRRG